MCNQCEMMTINGISCHEIGCPNHGKSYKLSCLVCGKTIRKNNRSGRRFFCSDICMLKYGK